MLRLLRSLVGPLLPYRLRLFLRTSLTPCAERYAPDDVERVKAVTAEQWRTLARRSSTYVAGYWDHANDEARRSRTSRRSQWFAGLPVFAGAESVLELGCGAGRNLYFLQLRYPQLALYGVDISQDAVEHARRHVRGHFWVGDLYNAKQLLERIEVDVIFTMGVLIHLHPPALPELIAELRRHARRHLVFLEQVSEENEVVKGPAWWRPSLRVTGHYIQWSPDLPGILRDLGLSFHLSNVPAELQANGGRHLLVVPLSSAHSMLG